MAVRSGLVVLVEAVRIDQRHGTRKIGRAFVVIDHDDVDPGVVGLLQRLMRHRAAIDGDDQAAARFAQPDQRFARGSVALEQAVGDIVIGVVSEVA